jgi:hypothetical protein
MSEPEKIELDELINKLIDNKDLINNLENKINQILIVYDDINNKKEPKNIFKDILKLFGCIN